MSIVFEAEYESWSKTKEAALKRGWDGKDDSPMDYADPVVVHAKFSTLETAVAWLKDIIGSDDTGGDTLFAGGAVTSFTHVPFPGRCKYCICNGWRPVKEWAIGKGGEIEEVREADSPCHNDDD